LNKSKDEINMHRLNKAMHEELDFKAFMASEKPNFSEWDVVGLYFQDLKKVKEISLKTGKSIAEVYRIIRRHGAEPNRLITNHENVRLFANANLPVKNIAELTGYTPRNIRYILGRQDTSGR
jgi:AraC-like DNA-binding protein